MLTPPPRPAFRVLSGAATRKGPLHDRNEDAWCIHGGDGSRGAWLFAVSDGISTAGAGDRASALTCERLGQVLDDGRTPTVTDLVGLLAEIDWELRGEGRGVACTLATALLRPGTVDVVTVGDSPVFLLRGGELRRLGGQAGGGRLEGYLGMGPRVAQVTRVTEEPVRPGDVIFLLTDGVSGVLPAEAIAACWLRTEDPERAAAELVAEAARLGVDDDATALVVALAPEPGLPLGLAPTDAPDPPEHLVEEASGRVA